ncbi:hypothetical protein [Bhargavaea ginsengi]|uniref:hypothetical protein n=1 Tax=Bhargavaea ginsengi TaxID=426757 RepID=UPI003C7409C9
MTNNIVKVEMKNATIYGEVTKEQGAMVYIEDHKRQEYKFHADEIFTLDSKGALAAEITDLVESISERLEVAPTKTAKITGKGSDTAVYGIAKNVVTRSTMKWAEDYSESQLLSAIRILAAR